MAENELIQLSDDGEGWQAVLLSRPEVSNDLGAHGGYRLATLVMGCRGVRIYEAVSGMLPYSPGHNMHVALSFAEMDKLIEAYKWHRLALEKQGGKYRGMVTASDDFDPHSDSDLLP